MAHAMPPSVVARLRAMPGNKRCVDCQANNPQWASVSFGALLCLECSGKHRGLGVHISFVRSVQMDSWSAKQIKMMEVGGNGKLRQWFEKHGVLDLPTSDKYNTPEAELYRERILALREGRKPPTKLAEPRTSASSASSGRSAAPAASRPPPGETPVERELRLRREAGERLRAKFGDKGLKGTFVTNSPMAMGGGGNTTSNNGTPDIAQAAGMAWTTLASYVQLGAAKAAQATSTISNQLAEAQLGEKVKTGVAGISSKLADPALSEKAKATASSLWGGALSGATSLWQKASTLTNDFSRTFADPATEPSRPSQTRRAAAAAPTSRASNGYGASTASGNGVRGRARSRGHSGGGGADSGDWMASELSKAKRELGLKPKPASSAAAAGWEDGDDWDDDWGDGPATGAAAGATTTTTTATAARATSNAGDDDHGWDSWSAPEDDAGDAAAPQPPTHAARAAKSAAAAPPSLPPAAAAAAAPAAGSNPAVDDSDDWDEDWGESAEPAAPATSSAAAAAAPATAEVNPAEPADDDDWGDDWGDDIDSLEPAALKAVSLS